MRIIISPAKKMRIDTDTLRIEGMPKFMEDTRILHFRLKSLSYEETKKLFFIKWQL